MRNKATVLRDIDQLRSDVKNIDYILRTGGSQEDYRKAYQKTLDRLDNLQGLVDIEQDPYKSNQVL